MSRGGLLLGLPAPAKINLFLHVLGRRPDGYHEIQSAFVPIDLCDVLDMEMRSDSSIVREGDLTGPVEADLAVRAARLLQSRAAAAQSAQCALPGVSLKVTKRIPVGAGLGGGSSDAATTLIGLNRLWNLRLPRSELARLGRTLGADVQFFLGAGPAFVEGVGERCTPLSPALRWYLAIYPQVSVSTAEIFSDAKLTRDHKGTTIAGFSAALRAADDGLWGSNDLEPVVRSRFAAVEEAFRVLKRHGVARMTGSGSTVFCVLPDAHKAQQALEAVRAQMPSGWSAWAVPGLAELPLAAW